MPALRQLLTLSGLSMPRSLRSLCTFSTAFPLLPNPLLAVVRPRFFVVPFDADFVVLALAGLSDGDARFPRLVALAGWMDVTSAMVRVYGYKERFELSLTAVVHVDLKF